MSATREALAEWKKRCGLTSFAHHRVQAKYAKRHVTLGILLLICTTATGTSSFVKLGDSDAIISTLIIVFTLASGVLAGIQTFLDYKTLGEEHKLAASTWEALRWRAERLLATTGEQNDIDPEELQIFENDAKEARKQSPTIHNDFWDEAAGEFYPSKID